MILAGRYELFEVIGRGGMGVVHRARDLTLDRTVAVKLLPADSSLDPTAVARFEREALAAAALTHPNIVALFDSGCDGDTRFIVMECVQGQSLDAMLRERGPLGCEQAAMIATQIASALAAAHRAGIVHRDIKPANVMVDGAGTVKVLDFGIVRLAGDAALTQTATVVGSAHYLAPELAHGAPADPRSDIYALGCVLYELLTGRPPFEGELPAAVIGQHISATARLPRELEATVPPALNELMRRMLAKDPKRRPHDAVAVASALSATLGDARTDVAVTRVQTLVLPRVASAAADARTAVLRVAAWRGRYLRRVSSVLALLAVLGAALFGLLGQRARRPGTPLRVASYRAHRPRSSRSRTGRSATTRTLATPVTTVVTAVPTTAATSANAAAAATPGQAGDQPGEGAGQGDGAQGQRASGQGQQASGQGQTDGGQQGQTDGGQGQTDGGQGQTDGGQGQQAGDSSGRPGLQPGGPASGLPPGQARKQGKDGKSKDS